MLNVTGQANRNCEGFGRRDFLRIGALGLGGLMLPDLFRLRAAQAANGLPKADDTAVIHIWCEGGPSQFETYDPKPDAPAEYRGNWKPINTKLTGVQFCELFPLQARIADKMAVIRSCAHSESGHGSAVKNINTGYPHPPGTNEGTFLYPSIGAVVARVREEHRRKLPHFVNVPVAGVFRGENGGGAYLGPAYDPFAAHPLNSNKTLQVPGELTSARLQNRKALLAALDRLRRDVDATGAFEGMDKFNRQAFEMVTGNVARNALDLDKESPKTRERYGKTEQRKHPWGQSMLLARRLVEAGVSFVTVGCGGWDDHGKGLAKEMPKRAPIFDQAVSALIEDLYERGLDKKVAVLIWGEFGRTPRVNKGGRDHWPSSMSVLLAGGGMKMGQVIGSTDMKGARPKDRPLHPNDVLATIYRHLGIDRSQAFVNAAGRPIPILPHGETIGDLISA